MTNHFHVLVQLERPGGPLEWLSGMFRAYVHFFNRRYGLLGHLWQGRFKSPAIQCEGYLLSCGQVYGRNPLEAGLVTNRGSMPGRVAGRTPPGPPTRLLAENSVLPGMGRRRQQPPTALA